MNEGIPTTRAARLRIVERLITHNIIESQQQLVHLPSGVFAYSVASDDQHAAVGPHYIDDVMAEKVRQRIEQQLAKVISGLITEVVCAQNLVVIHTPPGAAQYVASAIDKQPLDNVAGTIAGDDTVMMITTDNEAAEEKMDWLVSIASDAR